MDMKNLGNPIFNFLFYLTLKGNFLFSNKFQ